MVVVGIFSFQAFQARAALTTAASQAELLQQQLVAGDSEEASTTLRDLQQSARDARSASDGPLWTIGGAVPWLGRNVDAVTTVAAEIDRVATVAAPPVVDLAGQLNAKTFSPTDGSIDLDAVVEAPPAIAKSRAALTESQDRLDEIDPGSLLAPLRGPVGALTFKVDAVESVARNADLAARLLPDVLGGDGTRRYLLLNQNNAEIRPTGGIAGSFAVITAKDGRITLGRQGSIQDLPPLSEPVLPLTEDEQAAFPSTLGTDIRDVNITPDFPRTAELAKALAERGFDVTIDGVVTIDPVAVGYLMAGTGPVDLGSGIVLDQDNVVTALLHTVYTQIDDTEQQDDFFELANDQIFDAFAQGQGDSTVVLAALVRGVQENRVSFWSDRDDEQDAIATTALSGALPVGEDDTPHVGIYLSDAASTKMEYFLTYDSSMQAANCLDGDRQVLTTTTTLTSNAPADAASLTPFVTGRGDFVPRGLMRLNVRLLAPARGHLHLGAPGRPTGQSQCGHVRGSRAGPRRGRAAPGPGPHPHGEHHQRARPVGRSPVLHHAGHREPAQRLHDPVGLRVT